MFKTSAYHHAIYLGLFPNMCQALNDNEKLGGNFSEFFVWKLLLPLNFKKIIYSQLGFLCYFDAGFNKLFPELQMNHKDLQVKNTLHITSKSHDKPLTSINRNHAHITHGSCIKKTATGPHK